MNYNNEFNDAAKQLVLKGKIIDSKGWVPATSGNFSIRLTDNTIAITVSGKHKGNLVTDDIMLINANAESLDGKKPSAESLLHTSIYQRFAQAGAVLHPHSLNSVVLSRLYNDKIVLKDYELLKAFSHITSHENELVIPIFNNDQNILRLAELIDLYFSQHTCYAYIIAGHGLYTWGETLDIAYRQLEALDFLFACELQLSALKR